VNNDVNKVTLGRAQKPTAGSMRNVGGSSNDANSRRLSPGTSWSRHRASSEWM